jgi:hypothetical protein
MNKSPNLPIRIIVHLGSFSRSEYCGMPFGEMHTVGET